MFITRQLRLHVAMLIFTASFSTAVSAQQRGQTPSTPQELTPARIHELVQDGLLLLSVPLAYQWEMMGLDNVFKSISEDADMTARSNFANLVGKYEMAPIGLRSAITPPDGAHIEMDNAIGLMILKSDSVWVDPVDLVFSNRGTFPFLRLRRPSYKAVWNSGQWHIQVSEGMEVLVDSIQWIRQGSEWRRSR